MEYFQEELAEPMSPMGQCLDSSSFCLYILGVLEFEVPIHKSHIMSFLKHGLLSIPRFTSILVCDKKGVKRWKPVEVKLEEHIIEPVFSDGTSIDSYAKCFNDYLSNIAMKQLPRSKPLWELHVINYPTTTLLFKVHHVIGDGYTLMGVLLSCLQRANDPSLPLSFPSIRSSEPRFPIQSSLSRFSSSLSSFFNSISDFGWSVLKSTIVEDDKTPIRSGGEGIEFRPATILHMTFPMDRIKEIKSKLRVTVNDVITGIIFYGIRLYMQDIDCKSRTKDCTLLPMVNTRNVRGYQTVNDMQKTNGKGTWGNQFTYSHVSVPELKDTQVSNSLQFVWEVHNTMKRERRSLVTFLILTLLQMKHKFKGPEAVGEHFHRTMRNSSLLMSNMIGPEDQMALANHPIKGLYFTLSGVPQSLVITITSYMGMLRVTTRTEDGFVDERKLASYVDTAFEIIHKAAMKIPNESKL